MNLPLPKPATTVLILGNLFTEAQLLAYRNECLEQYQGDLAVALSRDTENGVKWLNVIALEKFKHDYPCLFEELNRDLK